MALKVLGMAPLLQVFDMPKSIAFYRDVLGFSIVGTDGKALPDNDWLMLELDGVVLMLNTAYERDSRPAAPVPSHISAHRDTCLYFECPDVDAAHAYLSANNLKLDPPKVAPYGMKQLYVPDPDGYLLCFQCRV